MTKNVILACGLGDIFTFLTRLDDYFKNNPEYTSIKFWLWNHSPNVARELVLLSKHNVEIFSLEDMEQYLTKQIPEEFLPQARKHFITQNPYGVGVDKYMKFMSQFFPNLESWVFLPTYTKYKSKYPYKLNVEPTKREKDYIIVHPFSTIVRTEKPERTWSCKRWGKLISMIDNYYKDVEVIIIGRNQDKIESIRDFKKGTFVDLRGETSLTESIGLIYGAKAVVGINSWPTLMSMWAGIPTYEQWFVQHQLIESHHPKTKYKINTVYTELPNKGAATSDLNAYHPMVNVVWENVRKVLDAAITF